MARYLYKCFKVRLIVKRLFGFLNKFHHVFIPVLLMIDRSSRLFRSGFSPVVLVVRSPDFNLVQA